MSSGPSGSRFKIEIAPSFADALPLWERMAAEGDALAFQSGPWLAAWSESFGRTEGTEMLAVTVRDEAGRALVALPLVRRKAGGLRIVAFADCGVTDYNAPILGADVPAANALWIALRRALPGHDAIHFERMPQWIGARPNPFWNLAGTLPSALDGFALTLPDGTAPWRAALPRRFRMELGRCDRLFDALPGARFGIAGADRRGVLEQLERLQSLRMTALGKPYQLDDPRHRSFYRHLVDDGSALVTALEAEGKVVAALLGVRHGDRYVMLRIAADTAYSHLSPGRAIITRTMAALASQGVSTFDFALGDYDYKRRLGGEPVALRDLFVAGSPRGWPRALLVRVKAFVRADPRLRAGLAKAKGLLSRGQ